MPAAAGIFIGAAAPEICRSFARKRRHLFDDAPREALRRAVSGDRPGREQKLLGVWPNP
jgi:hypothetical protein